MYILAHFLARILDGLIAMLSPAENKRIYTAREITPATPSNAPSASSR